MSADVRKKKRIIGQETRTILVDVNHILGATDRAAVAIGGIVVATVELVQDQSRTVTADILDLGQLLMRDKVTCRVSGVRGQQYLSATGNLLGDLVGVDVIVVLLRQWDGNGGNLPRHGQHTSWHTYRAFTPIPGASHSRS